MMEHRTNYEPTEEEWSQFARQAGEERDPHKLIELSQQKPIEGFDKAKRHIV